MIVDHLNTYAGGGAAIAARRIHDSVRAQGVDSRFWLSRLSEMSPISDARLLTWQTSRPAGLRTIWEGLCSQCRRAACKLQQARSVGKRPCGSEPFSVPRTHQATPFPQSWLYGDVLHLHWIAKFFDETSFFTTMPRGRPIVWTLHDMHPLTGGCHYSGTCEGFTRACGHCPQLRRPGEHDLSRRACQARVAALRHCTVHVVAPCRWLASAAERSQVFANAASIQVIPYGLDTTLFAPQDRLTSRQELGIPQDARVVGFGADALKVDRKGIAVLLSALEMLAGEFPLVGLGFGRGGWPVGTKSGCRVIWPGYVADARRQAAIYSAADVFALPSLEDNLPQTGLEAMACGVPVIGSDVGGIPDFVHPGVTGLLSGPGNVADLARQLAWMFRHPEAMRAMAGNARRQMEASYHSDRQGRDYLRLYESVCRNDT